MHTPIYWWAVETKLADSMRSDNPVQLVFYERRTLDDAIQRIGVAVYPDVNPKV